MENGKIEVLGTPVVESTEKPRFVPHNPLHRPKIRYRKMILTLVGYILLLTIAILVPSDILPVGRLWIIAGVSLIYFAVFAKKGIIWLVHLYQSKAPDRVRLKCVFEPSCSEYMILAVNKYGVVIGVCKGINRLFRCCSANAGVDYP